MESPSTHRWLGACAALSGLLAAGGCFCAALLLALLADSDAGAAYEQQRWLGAVVAIGAVCAFAAMMGWATLPYGGLPAPVVLIALAVAAVPFMLPGRLFLPAAVAALAACGVLATVGLARPPDSPRRARRLTGGLAATALALAVGQAIAVRLHDPASPARAAVSASRPAPHAPPEKHAAPAPRAPAPAKPAAAKPAPAAPARPAATEPAAANPAAPAPRPAAPSPDLREGTPVPPVAPAGAEGFVRDYYAALDGRRFAAAWKMLAPSVQRAFGGFAAWRRGYARTVASSPGALRITPAAGGATVALTLRAADRAACGRTVTRRFAVTWQLARTDAGWRATAATARALAGAARAAVC